MSHQSLFPGFEEQTLSIEHAFMGNVIVDRGSRYSVSGGKILGDKAKIRKRLSDHLSDKYFKKATHNTYAYRFRDKAGFIVEGKDDDGETGAAKVILTHLQRENIINSIVVVTRYFGGTKLYTDRFRHVGDATKIFLEHYKE